MITSIELTPPTRHGLAIYPPGATLGPRRMRDYEFVWILEGDAEYRCDGRIFAAPEGSVVLSRSGVTEFFKWDPARRTRHAYFHFDITMLPKDWPAPDTWPVVIEKTDGDLLIPLFQHVMTWSSRGDKRMLVQTIALMLRIVVTGQRATFELPEDVPPDPVDRAIAHLHRVLESDPETAITLDDLAGAACVTPEHLCRVFKKTLDLSPMECVRLARLDRSLVLLSRSNYSIQQVARMCGFASQFHFSRRFKQAFGKTPTQIRLQARAGLIPPLPRLFRQQTLDKDQFQA